MDSDNPENGARKALENLTDEDGPLYRLVAAVRSNTRLQKWSLALMGLNLVFMFLMTIVVLAVVGAFFEAKFSLEEIVTLAKEEKETRPEVVVDEATGEVSLVANVKVADDFVENIKAAQAKPIVEPEPAPPEPDQHPVAELLGKRSDPPPRPMAKKRRAKKMRVSVPINMDSFK